MCAVSVQEHIDCQRNVRYALELLEALADPQLRLLGHWKSPPDLPAEVLQRLEEMYRRGGWSVSPEAGGRISIWCKRVCA